MFLSFLTTNVSVQVFVLRVSTGRTSVCAFLGVKVFTCAFTVCVLCLCLVMGIQNVTIIGRCPLEQYSVRSESLVVSWPKYV